MAENTNTPNGVSNGYEKDLKSNDTVPGVYTADVSLPSIEKLLQEYDTDGDAFSGDTGTAVVTGDEIAFGEVTLVVGDLSKDAPGMSYMEFKTKKMEESEKAKKAREEGTKIDRNHDGIDDRMQ